MCMIMSCSEGKTAQTTASILNTETTTKKPAQPTSEAFNKYWYAGNAELTSFELEQARYGEIHKGKLF